MAYKSTIVTSASTSAHDGNENFAPVFKKARFAWQIKGKGRNISKHSVVMASTSLDSEKSPWTTVSSEGCGCCVEDKEIKIQREPDEQGKISVDLNGMEHNHVFSVDNVPTFVRTDTSMHSFSPAYMVAQCLDQLLTTLNHTNYSLRKWQTKQLANGIIDNTINKVLEEMGFASLSVESSELPINFSPRNIEAEGVSEAIRQRGLGRNTCHHSLLHCKHQARNIHAIASVPALLSSNKCSLHAIDPCLQGVTCTCWHYCRMRVNNNITGLLEPTACCVCCIRHQMLDKLAYVEGSDDRENLLNAAVTFAIGEKGLHLLSDMQESYW